MKIVRWNLAILCCLLIFNCASNVKSKKFNDDNLSDFKTFAYLTETQLDPLDFNADLNPTIDEKAIAKMKQEMTDRGYSLDPQNPDLVVLIFSSEGISSNLKKDSANRSTPGSSSASNSPYSGGATTGTTQSSSRRNATSSRAYQTGNMVIEIFNSNSKDLIWSGVAKDFRTDISTPNLSESMVAAILNKLPEN